MNATLAPIIVRLRDSMNNPVKVGGIQIHAAVFTGPWFFFGTANHDTNTDGQVTFSDLSIAVGGGQPYAPLVLGNPPAGAVPPFTQSFYVGVGYHWGIGDRGRIISIANPSVYMEGTVSSYNVGGGGYVVFDIDTLVGTGSYSDWTLLMLSSVGGITGSLEFTAPTVPITGVNANVAQFSVG